MKFGVWGLGLLLDESHFDPHRLTRICRNAILRKDCTMPLSAVVEAATSLERCEVYGGSWLPTFQDKLSPIFKGSINLLAPELLFF
jgi:hypothetical protein